VTDAGHGVRTDSRVAAIASMGSSFSPSFSPEGDRIAYVSRASGSPQVWVSPVAGGSQSQLTDLPDPVQSVRWSPAGSWLAYDVAPGGGLNVQMYLTRPDGSDTKRLTAGGEVNNRLYRWTRDGRGLAFGTNQFNPTHFDAFLADPDTGATRPVSKAEGLTTVTDVSRDDAWAVVNRLASRSDNNLYLVNLSSGTETLLTPHEPPATFAGGRFSLDARKIYVISNGECRRNGEQACLLKFS